MFNFKTYRHAIIFSILHYVKYTRTCLFARGVIFSSCGFISTHWTVWIAPSSIHLFVLDFPSKFIFKSSRCSKSEGWKWTKQRTELLEGCHWGRLRWPKLVHFKRFTSRESYVWILLQSWNYSCSLRFLDLPETQYLPRDSPFLWAFVLLLCFVYICKKHVYNQWCHTDNLTVQADKTNLGNFARSTNRFKLKLSFFFKYNLAHNN